MSLPSRLRLRLFALALVLGLVFVLSASCTSNCSYLRRLSGDTLCKNFPTTVTKTAISSAACTGVSSSRKLSITCNAPPGSATWCVAASDGSGLFALLMPNTDGNFVDSAAGTFSNCNDVWTALGNGIQFNNIAGFYHADGSTEQVRCTATSCTLTTTGCFSKWDVSNNQPSTTAASIASSANLVACVFIDSPAAGAGSGTVPPPFGVPATSNSGTAFISVTVGSPISFTTWTDY